MSLLADALNVTGTLLLLRVHWFWMLVSLAIGAWVGWQSAVDPVPAAPRPEQEAA